MAKLNVGILGATGVAGQQFIEALDGHPWFSVKHLYASERSENKKYREACVWHSACELKDEIADITVKNINNVVQDIKDIDIVFSALPSDIARNIEGECAKYKPVISTSAAFRYEEDVPILVPDVNSEHIDIISEQKKNRNWKGFVVPGPNCTVMGLAISLKPILDNFGINKVFMTSLQAVSGAGYPGIASLDIIDNIIPYIAKEEEKVQKEALKILGSYSAGRIRNADFKISCTCTRVPVLDGHTETVFVETEKSCSPEDYVKAIEEFNVKFRKEFGDLPSAPEETIVVKKEDNRPQPRFDRDIYNGMATVVGRIRKDEVFENGLKYVVLSHNTKKGAAKGEVLVAEYLYKKKIL